MFMYKVQRPQRRLVVEAVFAVGKSVFLVNACQKVVNGPPSPSNA